MGDTGGNICIGTGQEAGDWTAVSVDSVDNVDSVDSAVSVDSVE